MANKLTKAEKERYRIDLGTMAGWAGRCPTCNETFNGTAEVSQAAVVYAIRKHETEEHSTP